MVSNRASSVFARDSLTAADTPDTPRENEYYRESYDIF
jgi:hypothetical protein